MTTQALEIPLLTRAVLTAASLEALRKLNPASLFRNPVMAVVAVVSALTTVIAAQRISSGSTEAALMGQIALWLWFTVLFANFAEALAESRGRARTDSLRGVRSGSRARLLESATSNDWVWVGSHTLRVGDFVRVEAGDLIPGDGDVIEGIASINEAAITGESAPVIRESGTDRSAVTGGTLVVSDAITIRITVNPGDSFLDRMIGLVESAKRHKTPNEIALNILLIGLTIIFLLVTATLPLFAHYAGLTLSVAFLSALLVTLIPTTIGGLLSAIGIAGMDRLVRHKIIAKSGRAVEAAGDVDTLLIDKTGTITFGNRQAVEFIAMPGIGIERLAEAALLASLGDATPEGKSVVVLARAKGATADAARVRQTIPFSAQTRLSGVKLDEGEIYKGAAAAIAARTQERGATVPAEYAAAVERIARRGGTPLGVMRDVRLLGLIHLADVVKPGIRERFAQLRAMGIRTVMITGDNPVTAATIAAEAGVDDFLAEATPEKKLELIRKEQAGGRLVAMCGDGANDAPALAQADVGVAMNDGTAAAREAANIIDLDSDPTKLIEIVMIGKQMLISRGALTTFSIANDVAKYFAILPALFVTAYPPLSALNIMRLASPSSAILSAVIFNALIIVVLIPLALRGVRYRPSDAATQLFRNVWLYGVGGLIVPFIGIKLVDLLINALGWV